MVYLIVTVTVQTGMGLVSVATHKFQFPNGVSGFTGWTATGLLDHRQTKAGLFLWELAGSDYHFFQLGEADRAKKEKVSCEEMDVLKGR